MKKFLLLFALVAMFTSVEAQNRFRFGLQGTGGLSWMRPDTKGIENNGITTNYNYGIMLDYDFLDGGNYWLSTGINLGQLNGKLKYSDLIYPTSDTLGFQALTSTKYNLNYVEIPINLKMRTNEVGYMHYFGEFGLGLGINTRARADVSSSYSGGSSYSPADNPWDVGDDIRLFRLGLNIGFGAEYNLTGNTYAVAALRYHNGFTNIFNADYYELDATDPSLLALDDDGDPIKGPKWIANGNAVLLSVGIFF